MKKKLLSGVIGGGIGFALGIIGGGFLGLVIGGTFLGNLNIDQYTGLEGYELAAYIGAGIGALVLTLVGVGFAWRLAKKERIS